MRSSINCPSCRGSGRGTQSQCQSAYKELISIWKSDCEHMNQIIKELKDLLARLSDGELDLVLRFVGRFDGITDRIKKSENWTIQV